MDKIINGLKQIKTRVDSGTITTVNGTETLLSKQLNELLKEAINYSRCCESDSEQFVCKDCGHTKTAVNTTLEKICCAKCRSFAN